MEQLVDIVEKLKDKRVTTRRYIEPKVATKQQQKITIKQQLNKTEKSKYADHDQVECHRWRWHHIIAAVLESLSLEQNKKWADTVRVSYHSLKSIIRHCEQRGHFLKRIIAELMQFLLTICKNDEKLFKVGEPLFAILKLILKIPIYVSKVKKLQHFELFDIVSNLILNNAKFYSGSMKHKTNTKNSSNSSKRKNDKKTASSSMIGVDIVPIKLTTELFANLMDCIEYFDERNNYILKRIYPFFRKYFEIGKSGDQNTLIIETLNNLLSKFVMNGIDDYFDLAYVSFQFFNKLWNKKNCDSVNSILKSEITRFINLFIKIHKFLLPNGIPKFQRRFIPLLINIYKCVRSELTQKQLFTFVHYGTGSQFSQFSTLTLHEREYEFYKMAANVVYFVEECRLRLTIQQQHKNKNRNKDNNKNDSNENKIKNQNKSQKQQKLQRNESIMSSEEPTSISPDVLGQTIRKGSRKRTHSQLNNGNGNGNENDNTNQINVDLDVEEPPHKRQKLLSNANRTFESGSRVVSTSNDNKKNNNSNSNKHAMENTMDRVIENVKRSFVLTNMADNSGEKECSIVWLQFLFVFLKFYHKENLGRDNVARNNNNNNGHKEQLNTFDIIGCQLHANLLQGLMTQLKRCYKERDLKYLMWVIAVLSQLVQCNTFQALCKDDCKNNQESIVMLNELWQNHLETIISTQMLTMPRNVLHLSFDLLNNIINCQRLSLSSKMNNRRDKTNSGLYHLCAILETVMNCSLMNKYCFNNCGLIGNGLLSLIGNLIDKISSHSSSSSSSSSIIGGNTNSTVFDGQRATGITQYNVSFTGEQSITPNMLDDTYFGSPISVNRMKQRQRHERQQQWLRRPSLLALSSQLSLSSTGSGNSNNGNVMMEKYCSKNEMNKHISKVISWMFDIRNIHQSNLWSHHSIINVSNDCISCLIQIMHHSQTNTYDFNGKHNSNNTNKNKKKNGLFKYNVPLHGESDRLSERFEIIIDGDMVKIVNYGANESGSFEPFSGESAQWSSDASFDLSKTDNFGGNKKQVESPFSPNCSVSLTIKQWENIQLTPLVIFPKKIHEMHCMNDDIENHHRVSKEVFDVWYLSLVSQIVDNIEKCAKNMQSQWRRHHGIRKDNKKPENEEKNDIEILMSGNNDNDNNNNNNSNDNINNQQQSISNPSNSDGAFVALCEHLIIVICDLQERWKLHDWIDRTKMDLWDSSNGNFENKKTIIRRQWSNLNAKRHQFKRIIVYLIQIYHSLEICLSLLFEIFSNQGNYNMILTNDTNHNLNNGFLHLMNKLHQFRETIPDSGCFEYGTKDNTLYEKLKYNFNFVDILTLSNHRSEFKGLKPELDIVMDNENKQNDQENKNNNNNNDNENNNNKKNNNGNMMEPKFNYAIRMNEHMTNVMGLILKQFNSLCQKSFIQQRTRMETSYFHSKRRSNDFDDFSEENSISFQERISHVEKDLNVSNLISIGDIVFFGIKNKYCMIDNCTRWYEDTVSKLLPKVYYILPISIRLCFYFFLMFAFCKGKIACQLVRKVNQILTACSSYPHIQIECVKFLCHLSNCCQEKLFDESFYDEDNMVELKDLANKICQKLTSMTEEQQNAPFRRKDYPLTRESCLLFIVNGETFIENEFCDFSGWFLNFIEENSNNTQDYCIVENVNYISTTLLSIYQSFDAIFDEFESISMSNLLIEDEDDENEEGARLGNNDFAIETELQLTSLSLLAQMSLFNIEFEKRILFDLCKLYVKLPQSQLYVQNIYNQMSSILGYDLECDSNNTLMGEHLEYLLSRWCDRTSRYHRIKQNVDNQDNGNEENDGDDNNVVNEIFDIELFPFQLINREWSFVDFLNNFDKEILTTVVLQRDLPKIKQLCQLLNECSMSENAIQKKKNKRQKMTATQWILKHFAFIWSRVYTLNDNTGPSSIKGTDIVDEFLKKDQIIGKYKGSAKKKLSQLLQNHQCTIAMCFIDYYCTMSPNIDCSKRYYKTMENMTSLMKYGRIVNYISGNGDKYMYQILIYIRQFLQKTKRLKYKVIVINLLHWIVVEFYNQSVVFNIATMEQFINLVIWCFKHFQSIFLPISQTYTQLKYMNWDILTLFEILKRLCSQFVANFKQEPNVPEQKLVSQQIWNILNELHSFMAVIDDHGTNNLWTQLQIQEMYSTIDCILTKLVTKCPKTLHKSLGMIEFFPFDPDANKEDVIDNKHPHHQLQEYKDCMNKWRLAQLSYSTICESMLTLEKDLKLFVEYCRKVEYSTKQSSNSQILWKIGECLDKFSNQLLASDKDSDTLLQIAKRNKLLIVNVISSLIQLCRMVNQYDLSLARKAGCCLSIFGLMHPIFIEFNNNVIENQFKQCKLSQKLILTQFCIEDLAQVANGHNGCNSENEQDCIHGVIVRDRAIIEWIVGNCLSSENNSVKVIIDAFITLVEILETDLGQTALGICDLTLIKRLQSLKGTKFSEIGFGSSLQSQVAEIEEKQQEVQDFDIAIDLTDDNNVNNNNNSSYNSDNNETFWDYNVHEKSLGEWISDLCEHLIKKEFVGHCDSLSILSYCCRLVRTSSDFAFMIFPYIITDLLHCQISPVYNHSGNQQGYKNVFKWRNKAIMVANSFNQLLQNFKEKQLPRRCIELILNTIEYIRREIQSCDTKCDNLWREWSKLQLKIIQKDKSKIDRQKRRSQSSSFIIGNNSNDNSNIKPDDEKDVTIILNGNESVIVNNNSNSNNNCNNSIIGANNNDMIDGNVELEMIDYLKEQSFVFPGHVFIAHLDLLLIAEACVDCGYHMSAIYYCHQWAMYQYGPNIALSKILSQQSQDIKIDKCQRILITCHRHTHDIDGIYGIVDRNDRTDNILQDILLAEHERKYDVAFSGYDQLLNYSSASQFGLSKMLNLNGCNHLCLLLQQQQQHQQLQPMGSSYNNQQSVQSQDAPFSELYYESAWRLTQWDLPIGSSSARGSGVGVGNLHMGSNDHDHDHVEGLHACLYFGINAIHNENQSDFENILSNARDNLVQHLDIGINLGYGSSVHETVQPIFPALVKCQLLSDLENAWNLKWGHKEFNNNDNNNNNNNNVIHLKTGAGSLTNPMFDFESLWKGKHFFEIFCPPNLVHSSKLNELPSNIQSNLLLYSRHFDMIEVLFSLHSTLLSLSFDPSQASQPYLHHLYLFACIARECKRFNVANRVLTQARLILSQLTEYPNDTVSSLDEIYAIKDRTQRRESVAFMQKRLLQHGMIQLEEARYLWSQNSYSRAIQKLESIKRCMPVGESGNNQKDKDKNKDKDKKDVKKPATLGKSFENQQLRTIATQILGHWKLISHLGDAENDLAKAKDLSNNLYIQAPQHNVYKKFSPMFTESYCESSYLLGNFYDRLYNNIHNKLQSQEWKNSVQRMETKQKQIDSLKETVSTNKSQMTSMNKQLKKLQQKSGGGKNSKQIKKLKEEMKEMQRRWNDAFLLQRRLERESVHDEEQQQIVLDKHIKYLSQALINYCNCLARDSKRDLNVLYKLISLWFDNSDKVTATIRNHLDSIPSAKFIPLVYQIAARLNNDDSDFSQCVYKLVSKMCQQHPFHVLYQIFLLSNVDQVDESARIRTGFQVNKQRKQAADKLLASLKNTNLSVYIIAFESLINGYRKVSQASRLPKTTKDFDLKDYQITQTTDLNILPIPTIEYPVLKLPQQYFNNNINGNNNNNNGIPLIERFHGKAKLAASGITRPVIVDILGNDGKKYRQLVKPQDDLRQDAVMEQVFGLVNDLLIQNISTLERDLHIRTYKVIPLTPCVGIVEWVLNTVPIGVYLSQAHTKYRRSNDYDPMQARKRMAAISDYWNNLNKHNSKNKNKSIMKPPKHGNGKILSVEETYKDICGHFPPVMHKFFLEKYFDPLLWFNARLRYIRSCSVNSMIGYVLGLGDRHTQNILLDKNNAEMIHIDLGVAFDQGKLLKTPELVPFRLTRDVVDGFGLQGINGTFKKCCIQVLSLLREEQSMFYTVLKVFIHDPLYKWSLSPAKIQRLQHNQDMDENSNNNNGDGNGNGNGNDNDVDENKNDNDNEGAMRALDILKQKFRGYEHGYTLSVEGQVNRLIAQATDANNLARMFHGWASWM